MSPKRQKQKPRLMRIITALFVVALLVTAIPRTIEVIRLEQKRDALLAEQQELAALVEQRQAQLELTEDPEYIEKMAREQLGMIKAGERPLMKAVPQE
ncbi:MAG: septum formation initiator family protein [Syntrophomonadaceae bacterium]|nr:septum formation initiator family protein [Syntrophomonadaceae bacterium]